MDEQNQQQPVQPQVITPGMAPEAPAPTPAPLQYTSGQLEQSAGYDQPQAPVQEGEMTISWQASEFVAHEKNGGWFIILAIGSVLLAATIFLITREIFSIVVIGILTVAVGMFASLKPRVLDYRISPDGVIVGEKQFGYETFRSFAVIEEGAMQSIQLLPQKRFMVPITLYLDPNQVDKIIDILGEFLPFEHRERDFIDKLTSRFRF